MDSFNKQQSGKLAEESACGFLQAKGFELVQQNYRCFYGEIDLIMRDQDTIVFVEVRSRNRKDYGTALESINKSKINKLIKTAIHFLQMKQWLHKIQSRFDVVAIQTTPGKIQLDWFKNAFSTESWV